MESSLVALLQSILPDSVYPDIAPLGASRPFCTYQQVGGDPIQFLGGASGTGIARMQINVWASSRAQAIALIRAIEALVTDAPLFGGIETGAISVYEEQQKLYGSRQDFSFKY